MTTECTKQELPISTDSRRHTVGQKICYHIVGTILKLFFNIYGRCEVIGLRENIPRTGAVLLCANHASNLDPLLGWAGFYGYRRLRGVAKIELWKNKVMAYVMNAHDSVSVNRGGIDKAMFKSVLEGLKHGDAIGIFPEGTRTYDGKLNPGLPGIGMLVQKSGVPAAPVAIMGTYEMLPRGSKKMKRAKIRLIFGEPIQFGKEHSREQIADTLMAGIAALMTANGVQTEPPTKDRAELLAAQTAD